MIKKILNVTIATCLLANAGSVLAGMNMSLGHGTIDGTSHQVATSPSLKGLFDPQYVYDVACTVNNPTGDKMPAKLRIDAVNIGFISNAPAVSFDGNWLYTQQAAISDNKNHVFSIYGITPFFMNGNGDYASDSVIKLSWLAGDDVSTPITYDCIATPSVGK